MQLVTGGEMCINPILLPNGEVVACRNCWQCTASKVDDWVGRCIAESKSAQRTFSVTLTYGRDKAGNVDHHRAAVLTYSDVQKYFKRLRESGYIVRYFAVGEYGKEKGRAHWHLILFFYNNQSIIEKRIEQNRTSKKKRPVPNGCVPEHEISERDREGRLEEVRFSEKHWQHGWACWEELIDGYEMSAARAVKYVCKYLQKDLEDMEKQGHLAMSKKPPLGAAYFRSLAKSYVAKGLAPQDGYYRIPGCDKPNGGEYKFRLRGRSLELFIEAFVAEWAAVHGERPLPSSEMVEEWLDEQENRHEELQLRPYQPLLKPPKEEQYLWFMKDEQFLKDGGVQCNKFGTYEFRLGNRRWYWTRHRDGTVGWVHVDIYSARGENDVVKKAKARGWKPVGRKTHEHRKQL
jgi:hypothetical protein